LPHQPGRVSAPRFPFSARQAAGFPMRDDYANKNAPLVIPADDTPGGKLCVHRYLTTCQTNPQPPGFGDFLRGTVALHHYCDAYGYSLMVDKDTHPMFKHLRDGRHFLVNHQATEVHEFLPSAAYGSYDAIDAALRAQFEKNESFTVMTNAFYTRRGGQMVNHGDISTRCKLFLQDILQPNDRIRDALDAAFQSTGLDASRPYMVIHMRLGDAFLHDDVFDQRLFEQLNSRMARVPLTDRNTQYVLLSDASAMARELKRRNPSLLYWDNKKSHLGALRDQDQGVMDTLVDFFTLAYCDRIFSTSYSGFSIMASIIYDKPIAFI
jgi:hypothetical protein